MQPAQQRRYAPAEPLPPYSYVPGHGLPHPANDPHGHSCNAHTEIRGTPKALAGLAQFPTDPACRLRVLAATLAANPKWRLALDLFNGGWYWEAHEAWEGFWKALGRTTPEAEFVQGLIHLAAAAVKIREGKPNGVARHTKRARELLGKLKAADSGNALGLASESVADLLAELETYEPQCWHTSRTPVVRVLAKSLRPTD